MQYKLEQEIAMWEPGTGEDVTTDPFKVKQINRSYSKSIRIYNESLFLQTLYVARINYYTSESKIRREFESFGAIKKIVMVHERESGKPKGYCFIEYEHERDMHCELGNKLNRSCRKQHCKRRQFMRASRSRSTLKYS